MQHAVMWRDMMWKEVMWLTAMQGEEVRRNEQHQEAVSRRVMWHAEKRVIIWIELWMMEDRAQASEHDTMRLVH